LGIGEEVFFVVLIAIGIRLVDGRKRWENQGENRPDLLGIRKVDGRKHWENQRQVVQIAGINPKSGDKKSLTNDWKFETVLYIYVLKSMVREGEGWKGCCGGLVGWVGRDTKGILGCGQPTKSAGFTQGDSIL